MELQMVVIELSVRTFREGLHFLLNAWSLERDVTFLRLQQMPSAATKYLPWQLKGILLRAKFAICIERCTNFLVCDIKHALAYVSLTGDTIKYLIFWVRTGPEHSDSCVTSELLAVTGTTSKTCFLQSWEPLSPHLKCILVPLISVSLQTCSALHCPL